MIVPSNLIMLHKEEIVELLRSTVEICQKYDPTTLQINTKVAPLQSIVAKLDDALVYEREKEFTKELFDNPKEVWEMLIIILEKLELQKIDLQTKKT